MSHATGHGATTGAVGVRVDRYAAARGEKVATVRKRIQRGQLAGYKGADHRWYVVEEVVPAATRHTTHDATGHDATGGTGRDGTRDARRDAVGAVAVSPSARAQLEAVRDEWLAPLVAQITAQAERVGRLEAERDAAEAARTAAEGERDALRLQLAEVTVPPVVVVAPQEAPELPPATVPTPTTAPGLWRRLRRALGRT